MSIKVKNKNHYKYRQRFFVVSEIEHLILYDINDFLYKVCQQVMMIRVDNLVVQKK